MTVIDPDKVAADFHRAVNMTAGEMEKWLRTVQSRAVGWKGRDGTARQSVGHASGRRIARILRTARDDLTHDDYVHMRKVVGYVRRHLAQRPDNVHSSRWRYSLMNWGHDPAKEDSE